MSLLVLEASRPVSVILQDASGANVARWTLQTESREGRTLRWIPEGVLRQLGSGAGNLRYWTHKGWRRELTLRWDMGLLSTRETWSGSAWSAPEDRPTAEAHAEIHDWSGRGAVICEPFAGGAFGEFQAATFERAASLSDTKKVAHPALELVLRALELASEITFTGAEGYGWTSYGWGAWGY